MSATLESVREPAPVQLPLPAADPAAVLERELRSRRTPRLRLVEPHEPAPVPQSVPQRLRLSVVIPATNAPATLARCVAAIRDAPDPPGEIVVIGNPDTAVPADPRSRGPLAKAAAARNRGAAMATGDVLVFIDADVEVHPDAFARIRTTLTENPEVAALFGAYDDDPADEGVVSQFRNLLHHHVHKSSPGTINTFWTGLGAIRREAFLAVGGFPERSMEDVELGMLLAAQGEVIVLDPRVQGKHLKRWTMPSMVRTDLTLRGAPWVALALRRRTTPAVLNLGWRHRLSATASLCAVAASVRKRPGPALMALAAFVGLNHSFYRLLLRRRGAGTAAAGVGLHLLHHLTGVAAVPTGVALYAVERRREPASCDSDS
jgi:hypothetical protein